MSFFISPPFGNYINLPNTYRIKGSFTIEPRPGLLGQIFKTLRYSSIYGGWINKIGLRNVGIVSALKNIDREKDIISLAIVNKDDVHKFSKIIPENLNIEINISCPNIDKNIDNNLDLTPLINKNRDWCIIKLAPLEKRENIDNFYKQGFRQFHLSNTLKTQKGGLSGPMLRPYTNNLIDVLREKYGKNVTIIAGGGVRSKKDAENYIKRGADYVSVSTLLFNPFRFSLFYLSMAFSNDFYP